MQYLCKQRFSRATVSPGTSAPCACVASTTVLYSRHCRRPIALPPLSCAGRWPVLGSCPRYPFLQHPSCVYLDRSALHLKRYSRRPLPAKEVASAAATANRHNPESNAGGLSSPSPMYPPHILTPSPTRQQISPSHRCSFHLPLSGGPSASARNVLDPRGH